MGIFLVLYLLIHNFANKKAMTHEVLESISQRINGTEVEKNCRIYEIANELSRRCRICKCELREGEKHASEIDIERIVTLN